MYMYIMYKKFCAPDETPKRMQALARLFNIATLPTKTNEANRDLLACKLLAHSSTCELS